MDNSCKHSAKQNARYKEEGGNNGKQHWDSGCSALPKCFLVFFVFCFVFCVFSLKNIYIYTESTSTLHSKYPKGSASHSENKLKTLLGLHPSYLCCFSAMTAYCINFAHTGLLAIPLTLQAYFHFRAFVITPRLASSLTTSL